MGKMPAGLAKYMATKKAKSGLANAKSSSAKGKLKGKALTK